MPSPSLVAQLSRVFVALVIECDTAFEARMPHRTGADRGNPDARGPLLTSMVMWANLLRFVPADGMPLAEAAPLLPLVNLAGLQRWGYVRIEGAGSAATLHLRRGGVAAVRRWPAVVAEVEHRWRERFGATAIESARDALLDVAGRLEPGLPPFPPVRGYATGMRQDLAPLPGPQSADQLDLAGLLGRLLVALAVDYERQVEWSLVIGANLLRVLTAEGVPTRELPARTGLGPETITALLHWLTARGLAGLDTTAPKSVRLLDHGLAARATHDAVLADVEAAWRIRFTGVDALLDALDRLTGDAPAFAAAFAPIPDGWRERPPYRARTARFRADATTLPCFPAISHRGGYPDGS